LSAITEKEKGEPPKESWTRKTLRYLSYLSPAANINFTFSESAKKAEKAKATYEDKLEKAISKEDIFKYLLLIDTSAIDGYVAQTRLQADLSFRLCKNVAIVGFGLITIGIFLGITSRYLGINGIDAAYLSSLAGVITEFISGVFFYLYNRTLQQLNLFHDKMLGSKQKILAFLANTLIDEQAGRNKSLAELAKALMDSTSKSTP
jgi:hypothetical protein